MFLTNSYIFIKPMKFTSIKYFTVILLSCFLLFFSCSNNISGNSGQRYEYKSVVIDTTFYIGTNGSHVLPMELDTAFSDTMLVMRVQEDSLWFRIKDIRYDVLYKDFEVYNANSIYKQNSENLYHDDFSDEDTRTITIKFSPDKDSVFYNKLTTFDSGKLVRTCKFIGKRMVRK